MAGGSEDCHLGGFVSAVHCLQAGAAAPSAPYQVMHVPGSRQAGRQAGLSLGNV